MGTSAPGTGTLRLGTIGNTKDAIYPYVKNESISQLALWHNEFDTLTHLGTDGTIQMALAESMTPNAGKTVWTVHLRPGVKRRVPRDAGRGRTAGPAGKQDRRHRPPEEAGHGHPAQQVVDLAVRGQRRGDRYITTVTTELLPSGFNNASHWNNARFASLAKKLFVTSARDKQCQTIARMQKVQHEDGSRIVAAFVKTITPHTATVHGLHKDLYGRSSYLFDGVTVG